MTMRTAHLRNSRAPGAMLIELMIAIAIVTIGLLAMVSTTPIQTRGIKRAQAVNFMNEIAQERMEYVRSMPFTTAVSTSDDIPVSFTDSDKAVTYTYHCDTVIDVFQNSTYLGNQSQLTNVNATRKVVWVKVYDSNDRIRPPRTVELETTIAATQ
jgi:type II secretory pathway pseudopilin PulG